MVRILVAFLALILLFAILALSAHQMWGNTGLFAVLLAGIASLFLMRYLAGKMLRKAFEAPFAAKGAVLREALVKVLSVTPTTAPDADLNDDPGETEDAPPIPRTWYNVELTITPQAAPGPFESWAPGDLEVTGPETRTLRSMDDLADAPGYDLWQVWIWDGQRWVDEQGEKLAGPQRLRLLLSAPATVRRARLRYYFEVFGEVELPGPK